MGFFEDRGRTRRAVYYPPLMSLIRVAIVGRPNVGKSSLLNMLAKAKVSIVDPTPGVTRDRVSVVAEVEGPTPKEPPKMVEFTDTGGYGVYVADGARFDDVGEDLTRLTGDIESQIGRAVGAADLVLLVIDAQSGVLPADREIGRLLREGRFLPPGVEPARIAVVANKVDDSGWEAHALEGAALGFGEPLVVSAATNYRRRDFVERLYGMLPARGRDESSPGAEPEMRVAIVGKRNAGKSTMVNALAGEDRVIVSEIAGTTRDAVDVRFERDGRAFVAIDTAGVRKRKSMSGQVEWWAYDRAKRSIERADVCVLLIDATEPISQVDKQLAHEIRGRYKPCVIVFNKWDLVEGTKGPTGKPITVEDYQQYVEKELTGLLFAPIAFTSAASGADDGGVWDVLDVAHELFEQSRTRVTTGELNRAMRRSIESLPPSKVGKRMKFYFATQISVAPPTIVLVVNDPSIFSPQHERFVTNRMREALPFEEIPIRLIVRPRRRDEARAAAMGLPPGAGFESAEDAFTDEAPAPAGEEAWADGDALLEGEEGFDEAEWESLGEDEAFDLDDEAEDDGGEAERARQ